MNQADESWLRELKEGIWRWLSGLMIPGHPGYVRFCKDGSLIEPGKRTGLGVSCLALKTCSMLGILPRLEPRELEGWLGHIRSFQAASGRFRGFFEDPSITRPADRKAGWFKHDMKVRLAETRQACAALLTAGSVPLHPVTRLPQSPGQVRDFMEALDWTQPWGAGSHAGHLLFFYGLLGNVFDRTDRAEELISVVISELDKLQDPETGSWYTQRPGMEQIVNGAMKVLTGYAYLDRSFNYPEHLIDTCLATTNDEHACNNADVIYVLNACTQQTPYKRREIQDYFSRRLSLVKRFQREDGAFSFYPDGAQDNYYGTTVSRRLPESDVHGTTLFVWMLVMMGDVLGYNKELGWRQPVT